MEQQLEGLGSAWRDINDERSARSQRFDGPAGEITGAANKGGGVGVLVGAEVTGACVKNTVLTAIAEVEASALTVALASAEFAGAFAAMALPMLPDETAASSSVAKESAKLLASLESPAAIAMSNEMVVDSASKRRPVYAAATMLLIWSCDVTNEMVSTREAAKATFESGSSLKV